MALFNKFFFSSSNKRKSTNSNQSSNLSLSKFPFDSHQVRIVLYRECDSRGRRLLFDSGAIQKISTDESVTEVSFSCTSNNKNCNNSYQDLKHQQPTIYKHKTNNKNHIGDGFVDVSSGYVYKHCRPKASDISSIGEMVFGALAMSFRESALKVHWLKSPSRLLCSQVFLSPISGNGSFQCNRNMRNSGTRQSVSSENGSIDVFSIDSSFSTNNSIKTNISLHAHSIDVPDGCIKIHKIPSVISEYSTTEDSGYSGRTKSNTADQQNLVISARLGSVMSYPSSFHRKLSLDSFGSDCDGSYSLAMSSILSSKKISDGSIQRRIFRNQQTSFENHNSLSDFVGFIGDNSQSATNGGSDDCVSLRYATRRISDPNESRSNPELRRQNKGTTNSNGAIVSGESWLNIFGGGDEVRLTNRRAKLGIAVCITLTDTFEKEMEKFICEHIALLESMLCRLRASAENAYINHKQFFNIMLQAWKSSAEWINDLFTTPRLPSPIWLSPNKCESKKSKHLAENFMKELCWLLKIADTKDTNFFISTVLTAILTHHLGWVTTLFVVENDSNADVNKERMKQNVNLLELSNQYPYNALWAQLGDLYGAIGNPSKICRTIIFGTEHNLVEKLLSVLSYFIRCGKVERSEKNEFLDKTLIKKIISENQSISTKEKCNGLTRTETFRKNLNDIKTDNNEFISSNDLKEEILTEMQINNLTPKKLSVKNKENIKLTVTTPENVKLPFNDSESLSCDPVIEAMEIPIKFENKKNKKNKNNSLAQKIFWHLEPKVKEGLSWTDLEKLQLGVQIINKNLENQSNNSSEKINVYYTEINSKNLNQKDEVEKENNSLSDLVITENLCWENSELYLSNKTQTENQNGNNVVFVLGDNEKLINIKKSNDNISEILSEFSQNAVASTSTAVSKHIPREKYKHTCNHHKKHSGVKFNFEQYPQIATNYMKNKNIDLCNYYFYEKATKFEFNDSFKEIKSEPMQNEKSIVINSVMKESSKNDKEIIRKLKNNSSFENCEFCNSSTANIYQTPSNATDFESDDNYQSSERVTTVKSLSINEKSLSKTIEQEIQLKKQFQQQNKIIQENENTNFIQLPLPVSGSKNIEKLQDCSNKVGFIPSLLVGINDHYIPDMVLQATSTPPHTWEKNLKDDLTLSSHCASLVSIPMENIAVIADMSTWEVKIISSHTNMLQCTSATSGAVGVSQLVLTMLETVYAMNSAGISAYECLSFLEIKLKEMYVQSQALAAFLLATEFCSMSSLTSALNLSENDIPLLLSVASTHTPQVTKKYGISFR